MNGYSTPEITLDLIAGILNAIQVPAGEIEGRVDQLAAAYMETQIERDVLRKENARLAILIEELMYAWPENSREYQCARDELTKAQP